MAINYARLQQTANRLLTENGRAAIVRRLSTDVDDSDKPWRGTATPRDVTTLDPPAVELDVVAVFIDTISSRYLGRLLGFQDDSWAKGVEQFCMIPTLAFGSEDPDLFDEVEDSDGDQVFTIERSNELKPGPLGMFVAYALTKKTVLSA